MTFGPAEILILLGGAISALSLVSGLYKAWRLKPPKGGSGADVLVILPLTGPAADLEIIIGLLQAQSLCPKRLVIAVESEADPAYGRAIKVGSSSTLPIEVVVAGPAVDQSQKCRNLQAALERAGAEHEVIVFMDGDIRPGHAWLDTLVSPIVDNTFDLVTGHRWQQIRKGALGAQLVTAIDRGVTMTPRLGFAELVWGGSMAMSAETARRMDVRACLDHTLSDDLSISNRAGDMGLRLVTRGALLVASPTELPLGAAWRFGRRQYQMIRIYRPGLWLMALVVINLRLAGWLAALLLVSTGQIWGWSVAVLAAFGLAKQMVVADIGRRAGLADPRSVVIVQAMLGVFQPIADLFHSSAILAAGWTRSVRWGHVTYEVAAPNEIRVRERRPFSSS